jgi:hypothetical protein
MPQIKDLTNRKFGVLTAKKRVLVNKAAAWECLCECGKTKIVLLGNLNAKRSRYAQCRCHYQKSVKMSHPIDFMYRLAKRNATYRGIAFSLTIEEAFDILKKQNFQCAFTGLPLVILPNKNTTSNPNGYDKNRTASLDRIDSSKGYEVGNVQWVHKQINFMKQSLTDKEFINWCFRVVSHQKNKG